MIIRNFISRWSSDLDQCIMLKMLIIGTCNYQFKFDVSLFHVNHNFLNLVGNFLNMHNQCNTIS